jgi:hypothetical protein
VYENIHLYQPPEAARPHTYWIVAYTMERDLAIAAFAKKNLPSPGRVVTNMAFEIKC